MNEITIKIEGLKELTEALSRLAGENRGTTGQVAVLQPYVPVQQPIPQTGFQSAPTQQVPTTAVAQGYTIEQLQVAAAGLTGAGKMPQVMGILQQFGIQAMTELPKEQYGNFATALREAGAQI